MSTLEAALCCECGRVRKVSDAMRGWAHDELHPDGRALAVLKCVTCQGSTRHAIIRQDEQRNHAEKLDRKRDEYSRRLYARLGRLQDSGWEIIWCDEHSEVGDTPRAVMRVSQRFNGPLFLTRLRVLRDGHPQTLYDAVCKVEQWLDDLAATPGDDEWRISTTGALWRGRTWSQRRQEHP